MSRGALAFLTVMGALLAAAPALTAAEEGPHAFMLAVLVLALPAALLLRKRYG